MFEDINLVYIIVALVLVAVGVGAIMMGGGKAAAPKATPQEIAAEK
jgi:flagellar basal body-associated protein FliL